MDNRLSIYVSSPDSYADVFEVFLKGYRKYWSNCPYTFNLTTNTKTYEGINCICNNKPGDSWIERTLAALPYIKSKYILLMCDDLIINEEVDNCNIECILDYMDENKIRYCRIKPFYHGEPIENMPLLSKVNKRTPYAINLQIGIFRKDYFEELLGDGSLSAWDIESKINHDAFCAPDEDFTDVVAAMRPVIKHLHGVYKGKWIRSTYKILKSNGIMSRTSRPLNSWKCEWKINIIDFIERTMTRDQRMKIKKTATLIGFHFSTVN